MSENQKWGARAGRIIPECAAGCGEYLNGWRHGLPMEASVCVGGLAVCKKEHNGTGWSQGKHGKGARHGAGLIRGSLYLVLLHGQPSIILHPDMETGIPHRTGKKLMDTLLGQAGDGQV